MMGMTGLELVFNCQRGTSRVLSTVYLNQTTLSTTADKVAKPLRRGPMYVSVYIVSLLWLLLLYNELSRNFLFCDSDRALIVEIPDNIYDGRPAAATP